MDNTVSFFAMISGKAWDDALETERAKLKEVLVSGPGELRIRDWNGDMIFTYCVRAKDRKAGHDRFRIFVNNLDTILGERAVLRVEED